MEQRNGFKGTKWKEGVDTKDFIQNNYTEYHGDDSSLEDPTGATEKLWDELQKLNDIQFERNGIYDMNTEIVSTIASHNAGYLGKGLEKIVGLQTDKPLKRAFMPLGGISMASNALKSNGYTPNDELIHIFIDWRRTHNQGAFGAYTAEMRAARKNKIIAGLPDVYGRGRIIGDYRCVVSCGVDYLMEQKKKDHDMTGHHTMSEEAIRLREEITEQYRALAQMKEMAVKYGYDISKPAANAKEAVQWLYFGYLAAIKSQNGIAMSIGRTSAFLDIYIQRDLDNGVITGKEIQGLIDHLVMKLRMVEFARTPEYNQLFSGFPIWATLSIVGMGLDGRSLVTKNDFHLLHTLTNMGPSSEPNLTVLYSEHLLEGFRTYASRIAIESSSIQFENDNQLHEQWGSDDCAIACCVSGTVVGKDMQFFGARADLAKALLYAINGGVDEVTGAQVGPEYRPITSEILDPEEVKYNFTNMMDWLAELYISTLNIIHYTHDKYSYEAAQLALMDSDLQRTFTTGIAGTSHAADSLPAVRYAKVEVIRNEKGIAADFEVDGDFPECGNDDDRADELVSWISEYFTGQIKRHKAYRNSKPTTSLLTITSNAVYGENTGSTPDGHEAGKPLAPEANPSYNAEQSGLLANLNSAAKMNYGYALDGVSNTQTINPSGFGKGQDTGIENLRNILDGYFSKGAYHLSVNVFSNDLLRDTMGNPVKYPNSTIRASGYAVKFRDLTREQQLDVLMRTSHDRM